MATVTKVADPKVETEVSFLTRLENNIEVIVSPNSHIPHILLFLTCAGCTIGYAAESLKVDRFVVLTNFKMLRPLDLKAPKASTHAALATRWKCSPPNLAAGAVALADPWGPNSMCYCLYKAENVNAACTGTQCDDLEDKCYAQVVPTYAHVYAGLDVSGYNIVLAFFLIHMAVLLNMAAETAKEEATKQETLPESTSSEGTALQTIVDLPDQVDRSTRPGSLYDENAAQENQNGNEGFANKMIMGRFATFRYLGPEYTEVVQSDTDKTGLLTKPVEIKNLTQQEKHDLDLMQTNAFMVSSVLKHRWFYIIVFAALSATSFVFAVLRLDIVSKEALKRDQYCNTTNACMTQDLLSTITMILLGMDLGLSFFLVIHAIITQKSFEHSEFLISTYEDMHNVVAFMLLAASFGALSGVHDDTTLLFDVLIIMFIGFLQSVQHNIMLAKEVFIAHCEKAMGVMLKDGVDMEHYVSTTILSFFLYTRFFIFILISGGSFVFYMRLSSSVGLGETANWNTYMRFLASLVSLTPSFFGDVAYEIRHKQKLNENGMHLQYSGAHRWRRTIYLLYIIFFVVLSLKTYALDA
jgi:hypothetical protein